MLVLALLLVALPLGLSGLAGVLIQYPYLLVGFVGLVLFHAFRLQGSARTALVGVLLQTFVIMLPIVTGQLQTAGGITAGALALNGVVAVAGLYVAFAIFPGARVKGGGAAPVATLDDPAARTRSAAVSALVMVPPFTVILAFDLGSAIRVLFTIALVLATLERRDARETGAESVLSAIFAGAAALALSLLHMIWPQPLGLLLITALIGLLVVPHALAGRHRGAVALAIPLVWVLFGTAEDATLAKMLDWCLYSILGVAYAVWARALLLSVLAWLARARAARRATPA
jgi:hypothetical protein